MPFSNRQLPAAGSPPRAQSSINGIHPSENPQQIRSCSEAGKLYANSANFFLRPPKNPRSHRQSRIPELFAPWNLRRASSARWPSSVDRFRASGCRFQEQRQVGRAQCECECARVIRIRSRTHTIRLPGPLLPIPVPRRAAPAAPSPPRAPYPKSSAPGSGAPPWSPRQSGTSRASPAPHR